MRRSEAPYAAGAALVLLVSLAVLGGALATGGLLEERLATDATSSASASRAPIELSRTGRLAYWRTDAAGPQLWVANIDGGSRRAIAKVDSLTRVESTRWSPDGNAIAYVDRGQAAVVIRLDGARSEIALPQALAASGGARLVDLAWSTDSVLLAATVRNAVSPIANTDVWVAPATGGIWRNATGLQNAFLSQWISPTEILIHTGTGLIAIQRADGTSLTPLTAQDATSPFVADDGRIYYLAGQIAPTVRDATVPVINAAQASVWSMTADGDDIRRETSQGYDDVRLVARWSPDRFVAHVGASTSLTFLQTGSPPLATVPGVVDRVVFSPDRRTAIGLNSFRIYRYDTARPESPVVLLSDIAQPDAWYPQTLTLARGSPRPNVAKPAARYAFAMHGALWATDASGLPHVVRKLDADETSLRRLSGVAVPQWSPRGDRILYFDVVSAFRGAVFVTDLTGSITRISAQDAAGTFPAWTPDGKVAYADLLFSFDSAGFTAEGEVRIIDPASGAQVTTYNAREIAFGGGRTYLIDNGLRSATNQTGTSTDHAILEQTAAGARKITNAPFLDAGLPFDATQSGAAQSALQLSMLGASADGAFLSVRISPAVGSVPFTFAVLRASDGAATFRFPGQAIDDVRWSPNGHLVGMTIGNFPAVRNAETGAIVASFGIGRFAGWSPDGKWFYVARDVGLYALPLAGGDAVRISPFGVPVSTTTTQ